MWFKKKKPRLPKDLSNLPPDARRAAEQLVGEQLADKAINHRTLKQYDESLKWSKLAYEEYKYKPAASIHGNTLVLKGRQREALQWFIQVFREMSKDNPDLMVIEVLTNIVWLMRDYAKDVKKAEKCLRAARKLASQLPNTKHLAVLSSGLDVEEAILLNNKGNKIEAEALAKRRLEHVPNCPRAKLVLSAVRNSRRGALKYYGMIRSSDGATALDKAASDISIRLYRGLEEVQISAAMLSVIFLGARAKGWNADQLFATNNHGDEVLMAFSNATSISTEQANSLYRIIARLLSEHEEMKEMISFLSQGAFIIEEIM